MILRKFIGWTILLGAFMLGYMGFPVSADTGASRITLQQSTIAPAQLRLSGRPPAGWMVQQFEELVEIKFPRMARDVDLPSGLTGRLAHRVAALDYERRGEDLFLRLTLDCDCSVAVTSEATEAVLIDVINPNGTDPSENATAPKTAPFPTIKPGTDVAAASPVELGSNRQLNVAEAQQHLMEQLLRAADAGMVDLKPDGSDPSGQQEDTAPQNVDAQLPETRLVSLDAEAQPVQAAPDQVESTQKTTTDKADVEATADDQGRIRSRPVPSCFPDEAFAFHDPELGNAYSYQASELHATLVGEFDSVNTEAAIKLAQLNLSAGLGAEAVAILDEFVPEHPWAELYREIAAVLSQIRPAVDASLLKDDCSGAQRLWRSAALTLANDPNGAVRDAKNAAEDLEAQPRFVREFLAARIGLAAADSGSWEFARRMEAMANRSLSSSYGPSGRALLLSARLDAWHDRNDEALQKLRHAREHAGSEGEDALLSLAEAALTNSDLAATNTSYLQEDLAILAKADRGGVRGTQAFELWVKLQDHALGRDAALAVLDQGVADGLLPVERRADLIASIAEGTAFAESSEPLAVVYLENPDGFRDAIEKPGFRRAVVASMIDLGVPSLADAVVTPSDWEDPGIGLELARAHLAGNNPEKAQQILHLVPESLARNQLMASALLASGQPTEATEYLAENSDIALASAVEASLLDRKIDAAIASGEISLALDLGRRRLTLEPNDLIAQKLAVAAMDAGHVEVPVELREALSEGQRSTLETLLRLNTNADNLADIEKMNSFIDQLSSEIATIEEFLTDG